MAYDGKKRFSVRSLHVLRVRKISSMTPKLDNGCVFNRYIHTYIYIYIYIYIYKIYLYKYINI